jgi:hypothetical protein
LEDEALDSDFLEPESDDFEEDDDPPSELELLFESEEEDDELPESLLDEELSLASFISRERLRVP